MGNTVVIGVRVPKWVKEEAEKLGIDYSKEIREYLIRRIREEKLRRIASMMDSIRKRSRRVEGNLAAEIIRESRDKGWSE